MFVIDEKLKTEGDVLLVECNSIKLTSQYSIPVYKELIKSLVSTSNVFGGNEDDS